MTDSQRFEDFRIESIEDGHDLVPDLAGRPVLLVNVASQCGLTPQYTGLQQLHSELESQGFSVVGLPCNQFGAQEPGTEDEIKTFCESQYEVSFPLSRKLEVNGAERNPLYAWLTDEANGFPGDIEWNFEKFLIARDGTIVRRYPPRTPLEDAGLLQDIADQL